MMRYKNLYSFLVIWLFGFNICAQETYRPLVEDGKRWTYDDYLSLRPDVYNHYYWYFLEGDSTINGQVCKKMFSKNKDNDGAINYEGSLFEDERRVYVYRPTETQAALLYDFSCQVGDTIETLRGRFKVEEIFWKMNEGRDLHYYDLIPIGDLPDEEELHVLWIEGVGCTTDFFYMIPYPGNYRSLHACETDAGKIYQYTLKLTEEGYHEMGIEGKTWNYIHHYEDGGGIHEEPYSYIVRGDTIIGKTACKKVYRIESGTERFAFTLQEIGRSVLMKAPGVDYWTIPYDFGRTDVGRVFNWDSEYGRGRVYWMLNTIDTISIGAHDFRRLVFLQKTIAGSTNDTISHIDDNDDVWHEVWLEGVGSILNGIENPIHEEPPISDDYTRFLSCYENGKCIFNAENFTAIHDLAAPEMVNGKLSNGQWYDLSGRRIGDGQWAMDNGQLPRGVYIRDGKKVLVK